MRIKYLNTKAYTLKLIEEKKSRNSLEHIDTGDNFLNRKLIVQAHRSTINKWALMKLKISVKQGTLSIGQKLQDGKRFSSAPQLSEG